MSLQVISNWEIFLGRVAKPFNTLLLLLETVCVVWRGGGTIKMVDTKQELP